ncbi:hypothetical protein M758_10G129300 [Ceratodon purpureus]|nr:hypothetical protein M758_10G129300 [Ceratodon purpureus]
MGGSPKRGRVAAGCMSRGRLILVAVLGIQLLLVVCLMKAPRLIFMGTSSPTASDLVDSAEEAASGSWLWHRFVVEDAKAGGAKTALVPNCTDVNGREVVKGSFIECENHSLLRKINATVSLRNVSANSRPVRLPGESRLRRPGVVATHPGEARDGSVVDELRTARQRRVGRGLPARDGSVVEESGVLRQRRGRVETRLPARSGSVLEDLRVARERRFRVGERLGAAAPGNREAAREQRISSQLKGLIGDSLERDSFRFRSRGSYGDRLRGEVKEQARETSASIATAARTRVPARVPSVDPSEELSEDALEDALSEDASDDDLLEDSDVAIPRSETTHAGRRTSFGPLRSSNATRRSNVTSLEISEASLGNSTELGELEKLTNATAPSALFGALNGTLLDALTANVSGVNTTLGELFGARNGTLRDALPANVSSINGTLIELYGAQNASLRIGPMANVSSINATVAAKVGSLNVSLGDALAVNVSGINATLGELHNATLGDVLTANASGLINVTLAAQFGALNASLEEALSANVSGINGTLGELSDARNATLGKLSDARNATLGKLSDARNATLGDVLTANVSGMSNVTVGAEFEARNASVRDAVKGNVSDAQNATCLRGLIYVYTLPKKFNTELLENCSSLLRWGDRCRELSNSGLGPSLDESPLRHTQKQGTNHTGGPWYGTDQFNGEVIFHERMLTHPCRTHNPELAKAFYIPYYGGLDVARFLFNVTDKKFTAADRDKLGGELVEWLARSPYWKRHQGVDHLLMLGRITWDFRRKGNHGWGSSLINMPAMANVTKLALERSPWDNMEMAIPYPTGFHPRNDSEVVEWQNSLRKVKRDLLFSFAGAPRKEFPNDFRINLFNQCKQAKSCEVLDCSERKCEDDSLAATRLFTRSTFCLQPRGDSFTRRSIFDSLVAGCIPVFFWTKSAYLQYYWHLPAEYSSYSVFIPRNDIRNGSNIEEILLKISPAKVQQMQETILEMIPRLVYAGPEHELVKFKDAFDTTIDKVMANFDQLRVNHTSVIKQALGPIEENPKQVVAAHT